METALNALWDSFAGPGDKIIVFGAGVVGLLVTALASKIPGTDVTLVDTDASRAGIAAEIGARFIQSGQFGAMWQGSADVIFNASGSPESLSLALASAGPEAAIVEMSI
jgi:threonine dehydrogenase-like Zn-dependent dehydrogenase